MIPKNQKKFLFEIDRLAPKELLWIDYVNAPALLHQLLSHTLICRKIATVPGKEPQNSMGSIIADHEVCHSLVIIKVLTAQGTLEFNEQPRNNRRYGSRLSPLTLHAF
jgi:hypothetical protein